MTNNKLQQQLSTFPLVRWKQLLNEESPFYDPNSSFMFIFKPENLRDEELVEAERKDLAAKFDDFTSTWTQRWLLDSTHSRDFSEFCLDMIKRFPKKISVCWNERNSYGSYELKICETWEDDWGKTKISKPTGLSKTEEFQKLVFRDKFGIFSKLRSKEDEKRKIRFAYTKSTFPELFGEDSVSRYHEHRWYDFNWNLKHPICKKIERYRFDYRDIGSTRWLNIILGCYWVTLSEPVLEDLKNTHRKLASEFKRFSDSHMEDIVAIANYMSNNELRTQGESMKNAAIEAKRAVNDHGIETFRTDLSFNNHEAEVQKIIEETILKPIEELKKSFDKNKLSEDHVSYEVAKQAILAKREEQKRLEEQRKEEARQVELARREQVRLAEEKKRKECLENFMTMLRDSGHGHGHKDREGKEKLWYETEALAVADAIKLAKKDDRLLKPYHVTLYTEMKQPVNGWFLTTAATSKEAA